MIDIKKVDKNKINARGQYVDLEHNIIFSLKDEEIELLREYYQDPSIASSRLKIVEEKKNTYALQKKNIHQKSRVKSTIKKGKKKIIVGTTVVCLSSCLVALLGGMKKVDAPMLDANQIVLDAIREETQKEEVIHHSIEKFSYINEENIEISTIVETVQEKTEEDVLQATREEYIRKYCSIYKMNYEVIYDKLVSLTDHFQSDEFLNKGHIPGVTCKDNEIYACCEEELLFCTAIRAMNQLPERFSLDESAFNSEDTSYKQTLSYSELIDFYAHLFHADAYRNLMYGVFIAETGGTSNQLINDNNFGGLRSYDGNGFDVRDNPDQGAIEFVTTLKYNYIEKGLNTLELIQEVYAPGFENNVNDWLTNAHYGEEKAAEVFQEIDALRSSQKNTK